MKKTKERIKEKQALKEKKRRDSRDKVYTIKNGLKQRYKGAGLGSRFKLVLFQCNKYNY